MNDFVWNSFGTLANVTKSDRYVVIENSDGKSLKMSIAKYKESAISVFEKALSFQGQTVQVRTSQNTSDWSVEEWFSEIQPC
jgi:hypothetical protein